MPHTGTPDDHVFIRVKAQTGCKRCGYAKGHHPSKTVLATMKTFDERMECIRRETLAEEIDEGIITG